MPVFRGLVTQGHYVPTYGLRFGVSRAENRAVMTKWSDTLLKILFLSWKVLTKLENVDNKSKYNFKSLKDNFRLPIQH